MISRSVISLLVLVQFFFVVLSTAKGQSSGGRDEHWWYNFPSSPLRFEPTNSDASMIDLRRVSLPGEKILSYRLGCLLVSDSRVRITKRLEPKDINLERDRNYFSSASLFRSEIGGCPESKPVLAVVEVHFADGGVWAVAGAPAHPNP